MEMLVFMAGILLCLVLSIAVAVYVASKYKDYVAPLAVIITITVYASTSILYNNVVQEYFIGKRVTYEQVCTEVSVVTLYFK